MFSSILSGIAKVAPVVEAGVNLYGAYKSRNASKDALSRYNTAMGEAGDNREMSLELYDLAKTEYADETALREYVKQLAAENVRRAQQLGDEGLYRSAMQIYNDVLAGKFPKGLFDRIAYEMDYELKQRTAAIDRDYQTSIQEMSRLVPDGGVRTRMLAKLASDAADRKAAAMAEVAQKRRQELTGAYKELFDKALTAGKTAVDVETAAREQRLNTIGAMTGKPDTTGMMNALTGMSGATDARLADAQADVDKYQKYGAGTTANLITGLADLADKSRPLVETINTTRAPAQTATSLDNWQRTSIYG
jgi:hypothetical protein